MSDTIKRSDAIEAIKRISENYTGKGKRNFHPHIDFLIDELKYEVPSADRPQGEAPLEHGYMWTCPKCELEVHSDFDTCPRCGYEREDRPQGEWIDIGTFSHSYKCSVCGRTLFNITVGKNHVAKYYPYCHCGAKMKGADDES